MPPVMLLEVSSNMEWRMESFVLSLKRWFSPVNLITTRRMISFS